MSKYERFVEEAKDAVLAASEYGLPPDQEWSALDELVSCVQDRMSELEEGRRAVNAGLLFGGPS